MIYPRIEGELIVRPQAPELIPIAEKVEAGERISREDAIALFETDDLLAVGSMADLVKAHQEDLRGGSDG